MLSPDRATCMVNIDTITPPDSEVRSLPSSVLPNSEVVCSHPSISIV